MNIMDAIYELMKVPGKSAAEIAQLLKLAGGGDMQEGIIQLGVQNRNAGIFTGAAITAAIALVLNSCVVIYNRRKMKDALAQLRAEDGEVLCDLADAIRERKEATANAAQTCMGNTCDDDEEIQTVSSVNPAK